MDKHTDSLQNTYVETSSARVPLFTHRPSGKQDWSGSPTLRIQARRGSRHHMGAEVLKATSVLLGARGPPDVYPSDIGYGGGSSHARFGYRTGVALCA